MPFDNDLFIICASVWRSPQFGALHIPINPTDEAMALFPTLPALRALCAISNGHIAAVTGLLVTVPMVMRDGAPPGAGVDG